MANKYFRKFAISQATIEETIYTVPAANTAILSSLRVTNANTGEAVIDVRVYPEGTSTAYFLLDSYVLPVDGTMDVFGGVPCILEAGDELTVEATEDDLTFYLSYLEVDRN